MSSDAIVVGMTSHGTDWPLMYLVRTGIDDAWEAFLSRDARPVPLCAAAFFETEEEADALLGRWVAQSSGQERRGDLVESEAKDL